MAKFVVILWVVLMGAIAGSVITYVRMSSSIEELEGTVERQRGELSELSAAVESMSRAMRQVVALGSLRSDDDLPFGDEERPRPRLRGRGGDGEDRGGEMGEMMRPYKELLDQQLRRKELRAAARERMEADREIYSEEQIEEARELYHSGRGHGGRDDPERREKLEELVEKYPQSSMAGCALLQLARGGSDEEAESYYTKAIQGHSDSYCFGGTQVGAIARDRLADHYEETGQEAKAAKLRLELKRDYPDAVDHHGDPL